MAMVTMTAEPTLSVVATGALATAVSVDGGPSEMDLFVAALDAVGAVPALSRALATGATLVFCVGATPAWHESPGAEGRVERSLFKTEASKLVVRSRKAEERQDYWWKDTEFAALAVTQAQAVDGRATGIARKLKRASPRRRFCY